MRILLVGNHWTEGPGGAETMLVLTADLLRAAGHEVVPFAVAEERTLPTPVGFLLPTAAGAGSRWSSSTASVSRRSTDRRRMTTSRSSR